MDEKKKGLFDRFTDRLTEVASVIAPRKIRASFGIGGNGNGYDAATSGRRMDKWNASILGPNAISLATWQQLIRRSRDAVRNSGIAASASLRFTSNIIGTGIMPHFTHPDPDTRLTIQSAWDKWVKQADFNGQLSFYGLQSLLVQELFEAGECFVRYHVVDDYGYYQLQLIESEQVPVYVTLQDTGDNQIVKEGIIFNKTTDRRTGYRIYRGQPYDTAVNPFNATNYIDVSADEMIQVMKPLRAGAYRGVPMMAPVLGLLYDIEGYADAERLRKRIASMFAFFVSKPTSDDTIFQADPSQPSNAPGVDVTKLEPGSIIDLLPGEEIKAPELPTTGDYTAFMSTELHKFAAGVGLTYEQLTGDYKGVNYSSARVALLEFRRAAEQYQAQIVVNQFCEPIMHRWMKEAVMSGALELPNDYVKDPAQYEACTWVSDGYEWVDPIKEAQANQLAVRCGFVSRSMVTRKLGFDPDEIEAEIAAERKRELVLGIVTDTNSNVVLIGKETQPLNVTTPDPNKESDEETDEDDTNA